MWNSVTPEIFEIQVPNNDDYYHIDITVAVDTLLYRYREVPLKLTLKSPAGEQRFFNATVPLQQEGRWRGEQQGRYRVASARIRSYFSFNHAGTHTLEVGQLTSQYNLEGIHSLAVTVTKAKVEYDF